MLFENAGWEICESIIMGRLIPYVIDSFNMPNLKEIVTEAMDAAFDQTFTENDMEWNSMILEEYLKDNDVDGLLNITSDEMKDIMKKYPKNEVREMDIDEERNYERGLTKITDEWILDWYNHFMEEISRRPIATNYLLIKLLYEVKLKQNKDDIKQYEDVKKLANAIKDDIDKSRKNDMYDNLKMLNRSVYPYIRKRLNHGCSDIVIDIAYALTDIYDHVSEYDKSEEIGDLIYDVITSEKRVSSIKQLRMLTGCIYSITIAKVAPEKKRNLLDKAKKRFETIKKYIDKWDVDDNMEWESFLGMFESDYGAWYTNMADLEKERNVELCNKYCEKALQHQREGEKYRYNVYKVYENAEEDVSEYKRALYQSKSNIAGLLYRMGEYDEAIEKHEEILDYREQEKRISDAYLTREYIAGAYIEKWKAKNISNVEKKKCLEFLNMCKAFYEENRDMLRLKSINDKLEITEKLIRDNIN